MVVLSFVYRFIVANVLTDFSYLIYILLGSPLYNKKELSVTPDNIAINPPYKKLPMDYNNVNRWYNIEIIPIGIISIMENNTIYQSFQCIYDNNS